jgi:hypothetical protein
VGDAAGRASALRSVVEGGLAAAAYPTARFYGRAELTPLVHVASLIPLTRGLQNVRLVTLRNRLLFIRRLMPVAFADASRIILASAVSGAGAAAAGRLVLNFVAGDWARLLAGGAVATLTSALLLYRLVPGLASEVRGAVRMLRH